MTQGEHRGEDRSPIDATADVFARQGAAIAHRTGLLVGDDRVGESFGARHVNAAGTYRVTAEAFGAIARLLCEELRRGRAILSSAPGSGREADVADGSR